VKWFERKEARRDGINSSQSPNIQAGGRNIGVAKPNKSALYRYSGTLIFLALYLWLGIYSLFVAYMNPIPKEQELVRYRATVVDVNKNEGSLVLKLSDNSTKNAYFPVGLSMVVYGTSRFYGLNESQLAKLKGCDASVGAVPIKWLIPGRDMVWDLRCQDVGYGFVEAVSYIKLIGADGLRWIDGVLHITMFVFLFFIMGLP